MSSVPEWLETLLTTTFFNICRTHTDTARNENNMFCIDCNSGAFCFYCRSLNHNDHSVIQIRRSSYHDVVRVSEIQKVVDICGVQTYVINSARVLFLNERPQPKSGKGVSSHVCEICGRSLLDTFRFCSLGCKLVGIKKNGDANFVLEEKNDTKEKTRQGIASSSTSRKPSHLHQPYLILNTSSTASDQNQNEEHSHRDIYRSTPPTSIHRSSSARRRKGIPHRAPFAS